MQRAAEQGVLLSGLSSSWVPFLVHCVSLLRPGGRLAMVVPAEIAHAAYALPVVDYLTRQFGNVTLLTFQKRLFPELSQDTFLLLANGKDEPFEHLRWRDFEHAGHLMELTRIEEGQDFEATPLERADLVMGDEFKAFIEGILKQPLCEPRD